MTEKKHTQDPLNVDEALSTSEAFLLKNKNLLLGIVAAIVVIVAGVLGYKHFISAPKELKAAEAIFTVSFGTYPYAKNVRRMG